MSHLGLLLEDLRLQEASPEPLTTRGHDGSLSMSFNPIKYDFKWTKDWYEWDSKKAHQQAMKDRNAKAAELKKKGYKVKSTTNRGQLVRVGGIGSGHPEIDEIVTVYRLHATK